MPAAGQRRSSLLVRFDRPWSGVPDPRAGDRECVRAVLREVGVPFEESEHYFRVKTFQARRIVSRRAPIKEGGGENTG